LICAAQLNIAVAEQVPPNAGTILQQAQPPLPQTPSSGDTGLNIEKKKPGEFPDTAPFDVKEIQIVGNNVVSTKTLHALVESGEGKSNTLSELEAIATRITDFYHDHGFPLSRAIIPAQTIEKGVLRIEVIEARYDKITVNNQSRIKDSLLSSFLSNLQSGQPISQAAMDRSLLLLSDIPRIEISATLKPGALVGTSDLMVNAKPTGTFLGNVALDNNGNQYTGREHVGGMMSFIGPFDHGDMFNINVLSSGKNMDYGRLSYDTLLNGAGMRLGGSYSALHYILGDTLSNLNAHGTAVEESFWIKQPLVRSPNLNWYLHIEYDYKKLRDQIEVSQLNTQRHLANITLNLNGDDRDSFLEGGMNTWNIGLLAGQLDFEDKAAQVADAATAKTLGGYVKATLNLNRLQRLNSSNSLYANVSGQWANNNLDSAEKMLAGGAYSVRAYDVGVLSGDSGMLETLEYRNDIGVRLAGLFQFIAFVDSQQLSIDRNPWSKSDNHAIVSGAGVGFNFTSSDRWTAKAYVAQPVGGVPVQLAGSNPSRGWFELTKWF
jgi:hemolysin activation/secretion protein